MSGGDKRDMGWGGGFRYGGMGGWGGRLDGYEVGLK